MFMFVRACSRRIHAISLGISRLGQVSATRILEKIEGFVNNRRRSSLRGAVGRGPGFSPDGRWVVYTSKGKGSQPTETFVQAFPGPGLRTQIAPVKGLPVWRKDGKEIVIADEESLWSVPVSEAAGVSAFPGTFNGACRGSAAMRLPSSGLPRFRTFRLT
jgi:hypothetical protein